LRHLIRRGRQSPHEVDQMSTGSPYRQEVDDLACRGLAALDMSADRLQGDVQHSLDGGLADAEVFCYLGVREPAEVRQLDSLLVAGRQRIQGFVDSLPDHCRGEVVPGQRPIRGSRRPLDHQLLQAPVGTVDAMAVEGRPACARHQPCAPGVARRRREHDEIGLLGGGILMLTAVGLSRSARSGQPPTQKTFPP